MYEKLNFYILEKLIEYNNTNCFIIFTTNGSVDLDQNKKDLLKKFKNVSFNPVIYPSHFRPSALPKTVKEYIFKKFGYTKDLEFFIGSPHTDQDDKDFNTMLDRIQLQDQVKDISIKNYLPELADLIYFL